MFRVRRIFDDLLPIDQREIAQIQEILRDHFPAARKEEIDSLPRRLRNPFKGRFRWLLFVADSMHADVKGFALVWHEPQLRFWFLDWIATGRAAVGSGIGGALYERVRDEARASGAIGIFFECLPDEPEMVSDPKLLKQNIARLRFYERFGARPLMNNAYQKPLRPGQRDLPLLLFDDLGQGRPLRRRTAREAVRAILEGKYRHLCPPEYIDEVVRSFRDDPVQQREFRYVTDEASERVARGAEKLPRILLTVNDKHDIHHIRERGYVEAPVRIRAILREIQPTGLFRRIEPRPYSEAHIRAVHDDGFVDYLKRACARVPENKSVYPYVFPIRNHARPPRELSVRAGYYCIDTFTPLNRNAFSAAKRAVDCVLTVADAILRGERLGYALVRPPGHHAEPRAFGGFCYFSNCAVAAHYFSGQGKVAILDIDYHHGNGQQQVFYERADVLTISIHGHPRFAYPYFSGFEDERGAGPGEGFNANYPLPEECDGRRYRETLRLALARIRRFDPRFLVVALGLDPARGDPTGSWTLGTRDFEENGRMIGALRLPTLVVQEGGYRTRTLGANARHFFQGLVRAQVTEDFARQPSSGKTGARASAPETGVRGSSREGGAR